MPDTLPRTKAHQRYYVGPKRVPGTTTITGIIAKPHLVKWANNLGLEGIDSNAYRDKAADIGTLAHAMVEAHLKGEECDTTDFAPSLVDKAENALLSFYEWERDHTLEPFLLEAQLVSEQHLYGGTIDCYGMLDGKMTLLDFKTGKAVYDEHKVQVGGYSLLLKEAGQVVEQVRILRIGRSEDEGFDDVLVTNIEACERAFLAARELYEAMKGVRRGE